MWKWIVIVVALLLVTCVGTGVWAAASGKLETLRHQFDPDAKPVKVRLDAVTRGDLVRSISAPGVIEPRTKVQISAQVSARIVDLPFREGQRVKKGDVVVRLDSVDLSALLDSARAGLKSEQSRLEGARASYVNASLELERRRQLYATKDIAKAELDAAEADYARAGASLRSAEFAVEIAGANVRRAEKDLSNTTIAAPMDGAITRLNAEVGELVVIGTLNNAASVIMEIADLSDMLFKAKVDEANVAPVAPGQVAKVYINAYPERAFRATVERVKLFRQVDRDNNAYFETELKMEMPGDLVLASGLTANADIAVETVRGVLLIPSQAVVDRPIDELPKAVASSELIDRTKKFASVVYEMVDGKARARVVKAGSSDLTRTVIEAGAQEGIRVVIGPFKALQGMKEDRRLEEDTGATPPSPGATAGAGASPGKRS